MANVNFMMDDYQYKMYGIHVESDSLWQNCRCWQDIYNLSPPPPTITLWCFQLDCQLDPTYIYYM